LIYFRDNVIEQLHHYSINYEEQNYSFGYINRTIFVEVKTEIRSLGELIRQINQYKTYQKGDYYVLCPDNKYKDLLQEQGIYSIDYKQY